MDEEKNRFLVVTPAKAAVNQPAPRPLSNPIPATKDMMEAEIFSLCKISIPSGGRLPQTCTGLGWILSKSCGWWVGEFGHGGEVYEECEV
ncbi:hypothetical protein ACFLYR_02240 [Chloroflexota bacterium]